MQLKAYKVIENHLNKELVKSNLKHEIGLRAFHRACPFTRKAINIVAYNLRTNNDSRPFCNVTLR